MFELEQIPKLSCINLKEYGTEHCKAVIKSVSERIAKNGSAYLDFTFIDKQVTINAKCFSLDREKLQGVEAGDVVSFSLEIKEYNMQPSYLVSNIVSCAEEPSEYVAWFEQYQLLKANFDKLVNGISNEKYKIMLSAMLRRLEGFDSVPAAKSIHHVEFGGAISHCTLVALNCKQLATLYNTVYAIDGGFMDIDLIITGALIHDLGKTLEFVWSPLDGSVDYNDDINCLDTHITSVVENLTLVAIENNLLDSEEYKLLKHCLLSHHGKLEWGSPVIPAIPEALIISTCDKLDADIWGMYNCIKDMDKRESKYAKVGGQMQRIYRK